MVILYAVKIAFISIIIQFCGWDKEVDGELLVGSIVLTWLCCARVQINSLAYTHERKLIFSLDESKYA
jgi:hypothetical protein